MEDLDKEIDELLMNIRYTLQREEDSMDDDYELDLLRTTNFYNY
jgi:hypothetical protein